MLRALTSISVWLVSVFVMVWCSNLYVFKFMQWIVLTMIRPFKMRSIYQPIQAAVFFLEHKACSSRNRTVSNTPGICLHLQSLWAIFEAVVDSFWRFRWKRAKQEVFFWICFWHPNGVFEMLRWWNLHGFWREASVVRVPCFMLMKANCSQQINMPEDTVAKEWARGVLSYPQNVPWIKQRWIAQKHFKETSKR